MEVFFYSRAHYVLEIPLNLQQVNERETVPRKDNVAQSGSKKPDRQTTPEALP